MSVQRWEVCGECGVDEVRSDSGDWVKHTDHAAEVARLRGALLAARDALKDWGNYATEYYQQKHGLANDTVFSA